MGSKCGLGAHTCSAINPFPGLGTDPLPMTLCEQDQGVIRILQLLVKSRPSDKTIDNPCFNKGYSMTATVVSPQFSINSDLFR